MAAPSTESPGPPEASEAHVDVGGENSRVRLSRWMISILLGLGALTCGLVVYSYLASLKEPPAERERVIRPYNVEVFDVERGDLQEVLTSFGTARAYREVMLSAQVAGEIVEVSRPLKVGQAVRFSEQAEGGIGTSRHPDGEVLVHIDPQTYQERVIQAQNRLAEAETDLSRIAQEETNNAKILEKVKADYKSFQEEYDRVKSLREKGVASSSELTRALLELRQYEESRIGRENAQELFPIQRQAAERRRESCITELRIAELELNRTQVRAPFDGILSEVHVEQGQFVRPGEPLVKVTDLSEVEIAVPVTLSDHAKLVSLVKGSDFPDVRLAVNETAKSKWFGTLVRLAPEADELTRTVMAYVHVDNRAQAVPLLPGTFVQARIEGPVLKQALVVPRDAAINGELFVAVEGRAEKRSIDVTRTLESLAVVEAKDGTPARGIEPGEAVILTNLNDVYNGAAVRIQERHTLSTILRDLRSSLVRPSLAGGGSDFD